MSYEIDFNTHYCVLCVKDEASDIATKSLY